MKIFLLLIIILCMSESFCQNESFEKAYVNNSFDMLMHIFNKWAENSKPVNADNLAKKGLFVRYTYEIFEDFYTPKSLKRIGQSEWGNSVYKKIKYALVQNEVKIEIYDSLISEERWDVKRPVPIYKFKIADFCPRVKIPGARVIYLNNSRVQVINTFLKNEHSSLGATNIMSPSGAKGESEERLNFLNKYVKIFYGHWGGYWQITSYPLMNIRFNKDYTKALVDFRLIYEGGIGVYERNNNKWELKSSSVTWIE